MEYIVSVEWLEAEAVVVGVEVSFLGWEDDDDLVLA
jgi:hypothetical protein